MERRRRCLSAFYGPQAAPLTHQNLIQGSVDLLKSHEGVASDEDGIILEPAACLVINPRSIFPLVVDDFGDKLGAPIDFETIFSR